MFGDVGRAILQKVDDANKHPGLFFSDLLSEDKVKQECERLQHRFRERVYTPAVTLWVFLSQVLSADHSCLEAVAKLNFWRVARGLPPCNPESNSYCEARKRLPEELLANLVRSTGRDLAAQAKEAWLWLGRQVKVVDGSTLTMADTAENQREYPQSSSQAAGVGFPIARIVVVFSLAVGSALDMAIGPCKGKKTGENNLFRSLLGCFSKGDVVLADRCYASYWDFVLLKRRGVDLLARAHQLRKIDFRKGEKLGTCDHVVTYEKPKQRPKWMDAKDYAAATSTMRIRHCRFSIHQPGFRTRVITLATSLLDAELHPVEELRELYRRRWEAELHLRSLKTHMQMDQLRCKTPSRMRKEFYTHLLAYNLVRGVLLRAAAAAGLEPRQLSFKGAMQSINVFTGAILAAPQRIERLYAAMLWMVAYHHVGNRPDRIEPRLVKRRPKQYKYLKEPRAIARKRLLKGA